MKILIIANNSVGLFRFRGYLISKLCEKNDVYLSTPNDNFFDELEQLGAKVIETNVDRRGINPIKDLSLLIKYFKIIKKIKPDLVITYTIKPNIYGGFVSRILKIPYVVNITGLGTAFQNNSILKKIIVIMYKIALKKAKTVFFENVENRDILVDENIVNKNNTVVLNGAGVNLDEFSLTEYPTETEETKFLFLGRIMKEKGIEELLCACKRLHNEGYKIKLELVGRAEENYDDIISQYEKDGWLKYHGFQADVKSFIKECNCFVLPSYHEGMANTNLECGAMGRPIVTSNIHGCKEAVIDGVSGYLCEKQNVESLYNAMKKFIELPLDSKREFGLNGRKHMENEFDKNKVVEKTIKNL